MKNAGKRLEDIKNGYTLDEHNIYHCNFCDACFEDGEIFPIDGHFYRAQKAMEMHIKKEHSSVFAQLLQLDKKSSTVTDVQKKLLQYMYEGKSDKEIAELTNTSPSTVRHQRFVFKEKAKQMRMYLALYELSLEGSFDDLIDVHDDARGVDERFVATLEEQQQVYDTMFVSQDPLRLKQIPAKEKKKIMVLRRICEELEPHRVYTENELNEFLKGIYEDHVTLRRYLIEYAFLHRTQDCTKYSMDANAI
ncbi:DUF2087 domain-containing protein [Amedibacillus sp. YH-ame10]